MRSRTTKYFFYSEKNNSEVVQTEQLSHRWNEQNPFQVGEQIIDVLTKIRGTVEAIEGEKVFFYCREFGRVWRQWDLIVKSQS